MQYPLGSLQGSRRTELGTSKIEALSIIVHVLLVSSKLNGPVGIDLIRDYQVSNLFLLTVGSNLSGMV